MVYSRAPLQSKRTTFIGKVCEVSPEIILEYSNRKQKMLLTKPSKIEVNTWIRVFGAARNNIFIVDAFHRIKYSEAVYFNEFRKRVRQFYININ